ncbi:MAG: epoxyqueuosine reductase [Methanobacterium sp.]|nr:epoxyqueuosine reductase [Methanobacterium sp.]
MSENNKTVCCPGDSDRDQQKSGCGCSNQTVEETSICGCGGKFPDESQVANPEENNTTADAEFFKELLELAKSLGIVKIGYTTLDPELVIFEEPLYPNAIVLTMEMGNDLIKTSPSEKAQEMNDALYAKLATIIYKISDFIRSEGHATQVAHPYEDLVNLTKLGQKAGLGWMGKHGLLITPELGPRLKISAILTSIENLPLKEGADHSWISQYCDRCSKCRIACPENALVEKIHPDGGKETEFKSELCLGCQKGCTYCIEECIFDKREYADIKKIHDKLTARLAIKKPRR